MVFSEGTVQTVVIVQQDSEVSVSVDSAVNMNIKNNFFSALKLQLCGSLSYLLAFISEIFYSIISIY